MGTITVARFVVGLLPLQGSRQRTLCAHANYTLVADPRWGMPDGRDLPALLLCSDAAQKKIRRVTVSKNVSRKSLMRVATLKIERHRGQLTQSIPVAERWDDEGIILSPAFVALCADSTYGELPFEQLLELPPGAIALAMALATSSSTSIAIGELATLIGSRNANRASAWQQLRGWLGKLAKILPKWAYDAVQKVLFRQANYVPRRPAKARGTGENESEHLRLVAYRSKQHHNKRQPERSSDAGELRPFSIAFCNPLKRDNQGNSS